MTLQDKNPTWVEDEITLEQKQVPALTIEKGQGLNDFTISLNSTNETFSVNDTPITTPSPMGAEAENLQIADINVQGTDVTMLLYGRSKMIQIGMIFTTKICL